MSEEAILTGKAKKAKRSEERLKKRQKGNKDTKAEDHAVENLKDEQRNAQGILDKAVQGQKRKRIDQTAEASIEATKEDVAKSGSSKPKKRRKETNATDQSGETGADEEGQGHEGASGKHRFIVFIGNLPFSATNESISQHFSTVSPSSVRHITDPKTKKSKGYAFLEFSNYDRMKTCLKTFHHSVFEGTGGKDRSRKINVELTAGGGGKGEQRKEKLKTKNQKLDEERKRRAEALAKQDKKKRAKGANGDAGAEAAEDGADGGQEAVSQEQKAEPATEGMHPARLARIQGR